MAHTIDDLRELGYTVGIAYGGVAVEEEALAAARAAAAPEQVRLDAEPIIAKAVADFILLTKDDSRVGTDEVAAFIARVTAQTLRMLSQGRDERVEFHERAGAIAKEMPTVFSVKGFGIIGQTCCADDAGTTPYTPEDEAGLASLCDPALHTERKFQHEYPEAAAARAELHAKGYEVVRPDPAANIFDVKEPGTGTVVAPKQNPPDLPPLAETLPDLNEG